MTRNDFEMVADVLAGAKPAYSSVERGVITLSDYDAQLCQWAWTVRRMSARLRSLNPRFDKDRFHKACGLI